ncbi:protein kinase [Streptomyces sp. NPDC057271]|uniref:serine/threonine-protein kinase n=1 Tax=unclassified Streptomyces TaxID=2593676 RepID=UPI003644772F
MRTLDRYELRSLIGRGNMGHVWQAWDTRLRRYVAIKTINPERLTGPATDVDPKDIAARFRREAVLGARFSHAGLPTLYDAQLDGGPKDLYLVWELLVGQNLAQVLSQEGGRLPIPRVLSLAAQMTDVLACIHEDPVIHRDLKPANFMIIGDWKVKLLDFGVAAIFGTDHPRLTQAGQVLGTVAYMAPEQFSDRGLIDPKTDLYALGCLLYEMLTGQPPFTGDHATMMDGHRYRIPAPVRELRPDIIPDVNDVVMSMLEKDAVNRPASARHIADRLAPHHTVQEPSSDHPAGGTDKSVDIPTEATAPPLPLSVRLVQAQALFDDGRYGDALQAYNRLSAELAYTTADGADRAAEARSRAAYCHLRLGNREESLLAYEALARELGQDRPAVDTLLLDVRTQLGLLQAATHRTAAALDTFADIYPMLVKHLGQNASQTTDVRAALNRINQLGGFPRQDATPTPQGS